MAKMLIGEAGTHERLHGKTPFGLVETGIASEALGQQDHRRLASRSKRIGGKITPRVLG
jgi:hypothetical protein